MGAFIHRNGDKYREWLTIPDGYGTPPLTRAEMTRYLAERRGQKAVEIEDRLARADRFGTSCLGDTREATCWDVERCLRCATFHHTYEPGAAAGVCRVCGEPANDIAHRPPCATKETPSPTHRPSPLVWEAQLSVVPPAPAEPIEPPRAPFAPPLAPSDIAGVDAQIRRAVLGAEPFGPAPAGSIERERVLHPLLRGTAIGPAVRQPDGTYRVELRVEQPHHPDAYAAGAEAMRAQVADKLLRGARFYARLAGHLVDPAGRRSHRAVAVALRDAASDLPAALAHPTETSDR
jgi:hypothetical protein